MGANCWSSTTATTTITITWRPPLPPPWPARAGAAPRGPGGDGTPPGGEPGLGGVGAWNRPAATFVTAARQAVGSGERALVVAAPPGGHGLGSTPRNPLWLRAPQLSRPAPPAGLGLPGPPTAPPATVGSAAPPRVGASGPTQFPSLGSR